MKCKLSVLVILYILFTVSAVCAVDADNSTFNLADDLNYNDDILFENEVPDIPDLVVDKQNHVNPYNIDLYFKEGVLKNEFKGETLIFSGNFDDLGTLTINSDKVKVIGENSSFKNTVFNIQSNGIVLKNLTFDLDKSIVSNNGAAILVSGYDVILDSLDINYVVPSDVEAYAILADGSNYYSSENIKIINSNIYFEGHNDNVNKYNCAIKLTYANSALIENNTVRSSLPLKNVKYGMDGATLDSDYVYVIGLEECMDFIIKNNTIVLDVNKRTAVEYPTLNCIMLSKSDNGQFVNNSVYMTDFVTYPGIENYIYGLDIYKLNDILVMNNKISMITTGGKLALGTAYPIQICGPASGVNITYNDLYSFSNGPNIGIYSQNYYGPTDISITNNRINVTGLAGTHDWALVTGIESQDTNAEILNNIIEVHSVSEVNEDDNLYAISYRQSTVGEHSFNIQNNKAFTDGYYAVYLLSSDNSIINDNVLISSNDNVNTGDDSYSPGFREHNDDEYSNNVVFNARDYYGFQNSININSYENEGILNYINGNDIGWNSQNQQSSNYNPLIPHYSIPINSNSDKESNIIDNYQDDGSVHGIITDDIGSNLHGQSDSNQINIFKSDGKSNVDTVYSENKGDFDLNGIANTNSNSSDSTPAIGTDGNPLSKSQSSSKGESQSVSKSYEISKVDKKEFVPSIFFVIAACILLCVGYKRKNDNFE